MTSAVLLYSSTSFSAPSDPVITAIPPAGSHVSTKGYGINRFGAVAAKSFTTNDDDVAMVWDIGHGATELSSLVNDSESSTWGVSDTGHVSGFSRNDEGEKRAVVWDASGKITDIGALANPDTLVEGPSSDAYEVADDGTVVGLADIPNSDNTFTPFHAFIYNGTITDLGTFSTYGAEYQYGYSIAYDINAAHAIVGCAHNDSWQLFPFIYTEEGGMEQLLIDPDRNDWSYEWYAVTINNSGVIGGMVITDTGDPSKSYPYYWSDKSVVPTAIPMPAEYPYGEVYGINEDGQMVGIMWNDDGTEHGFLFSAETGTVDLNDLLQEESGWIINFARDINNYGQISGGGTLNRVERGFLLDSRGVHTDDDEIADNWELAYFGNLTTCTSTSDFDGDGYSDYWEYRYHSKGQVDKEGTPFHPDVVNALGGVAGSGGILQYMVPILSTRLRK